MKCKMDVSKWRSLRERIQLVLLQRKPLEGANSDVQIVLNWDVRNTRDETQNRMQKTHTEPLITQ